MQIINGKIVETVETDLAHYIALKRDELDQLAIRQAAVMAELEALIPKENV